MRKMNYAYDSNIILDKCDRCGGIWADFGEVMKLAVFRKGNPLLNRMGEAIARDRGELLNQRLGNLDSSATSSPWYWQCAPRIILPLGDSQERESLPFVVIGIALLNIIICIIQLCTSGSGTEVFYRRYGLVPVEAFSSITYSYHYITSMFIHGGVFHLAGNLLYLWIFADNIEDRLGHWTFLLLYILFGISADFTHIILSPHSNIPAIGASGAVAGTMGAYMILFPASNIKTYVYGKIMNIPAYIYIGGWIALQLANTYLTAGQKSGVAFGAHIGGFFTGLLIGTCVKFMLREE
jgi:membrane associated rhomboid family serine protease